MQKLKKYSSELKLKTVKAYLGEEVYMTKGRKTTQEERAKISLVGRCLYNAPMESWRVILKSEMYSSKSSRAVNPSFPLLRITYTFTILAITKSV